MSFQMAYFVHKEIENEKLYQDEELKKLKALFDLKTNVRFY